MNFMKKRLSGAFGLAGLLLLACACSQEEGIGGSCKISGTIVERVYNDDFSLLLEKRAPVDEDVFLAFGSENAVGEDTKTGLNGEFEFNYLWPGNYTLFYYSEDSLYSKEEVARTIDITLSGKEKLKLDTLYIDRTRDWDEGNATIFGKVMVTNYKNSSSWPYLEEKDVTPAQEQEVYITYGNHPFYDERTRTQDDGTFYFRNLIKGTYRIFLYSEDVTGGTAYITKEYYVTIDEDMQEVDLSEQIGGTINIEKL